MEFSYEQGKLVLSKYDAVGDMEQLLDSVESGIKLSDTLLKPGTSYRLLEKVKEMREILKG